MNGGTGSAAGDSSMVKIMQSLSLDFKPAISSIHALETRIAMLNKQLFDLKTNAMAGANDINRAFASQFGGTAGSPLNFASQYAANSNVILDQYGGVLKRVKGVKDEINNISTKPVKPITIPTPDDKNLNIFAQGFQRRAEWFLSGGIFYGVINAAKEAVQSISEVEMGITEVARVMEDSSFVFERFRDDVIQLGVDYGQTFNTVQDITLRWAQAGYNVKDTLDLTKTSLLALNTAELDAHNATESMVGIMAQWNLTAQELPLVLDKINITADDFTVTSQDLVDGMLRSSGAARIMGLSIDETIALLTVMREASGRTGREVGNALNSILSYIQRPSAINAMEGLGIQVFADAAKTEFRNVMEIFQDVASRWGTLAPEIQDGFVKAADDAGLFNEELANAIGVQQQWNDLQQRDLSQAAAGIYRRNYFIGMIERLSKSQDVLNNMTDAAGYSQRENARTMDTLAKKYESLKASATQLAISLGDSGLTDILKGLLDIGTGAIQMFEKFPKPVRDGVMAFSAMMLVLKTGQQALKLFGITTADTAVKSKIAANAMGEMTAATAAQAAATNTATAASKGFMAANKWLLIISAAVGVISAIVGAINRYREEQEQLEAATKETTKRLEEQVAQANRDLATLRNVSASTEELTEARQRLAESFPDIIIGYTDEGEAIIANNDAIREQIELTEEAIEKNKELIKDIAAASLDDAISDREEALSRIERLRKKYDEAVRYRDDPEAFKQEVNPTWTDQDIVETHKQVIGITASEMIEANAELEKTTTNLRDKYRALIPDMEKYSEAQRIIANEYINQAAAEGELREEEFLKALEVAVNDTDKLRQAMAELAKQQDQMQDNTFSYAIDVQNLKNAFSDAKSEVSSLNQAIYDLNSGNSLSIEQAAELAMTYLDLAGSIEETADGYTIEVSILEELRQKRLEEQTTALITQAGITEVTTTELSKRLAAYGIELAAINSLNVARDAMNKLPNLLPGAQGHVPTDVYNRFQSEVQPLKVALEEYGKLMDTVNLFRGMFEDPLFGVSGTGSGGGSGQNEALQQALRLYEHERAMGELSLEEEEARLTEIKNLHAKSAEEIMDMEERIYSVQKRIRDNALADDEERIKNIEDTRKRAMDTYKDTLKSVQDSVKKAYEERIGLIDDEIDKIDDQIKALERAEEAHDYGNKIDDLQEELEYWQVRTSEEARKKVKELTEQIAEAEHDREVELQKQTLEDKKDVLEEEKERWKDVYAEIEEAFEGHNLDLVSQAAVTSKEVFLEWEKNYIIPMQEALKSGDFTKASSLSSQLPDSISDMAKHDWDMTHEDYTQFIANGQRWAELQRQGSNPTIDEEMRSLNAANDALRIKYGKDPALGEYPNFDKGGLTISAGFAKVIPGDFYFPPSLSQDIRALIAIAGGISKKASTSDTKYDNSKDVRIGKMLNIEHFHNEDQSDSEILLRQLGRELQRIV